MRKLFVLSLLSVLLWSAPHALASSWIIVDDNTGHVLGRSEDGERRQIASLTKIATAMVVLDWAQATNTSLANAVGVPDAITGVGGVNPCGLQPGDSVSLRDLLYSAMMSSDNHAAYTLAWNVGSKLPNSGDLSPVDNFTAHMNALARKLDMDAAVLQRKFDGANAAALLAGGRADLANDVGHALHVGHDFAHGVAGMPCVLPAVVNQFKGVGGKGFL
jgi:D-alanyl-D-alanine carboxypeptidase (penicillin-binding protein 5/6)